MKKLITLLILLTAFISTADAQFPHKKLKKLVQIGKSGDTDSLIVYKPTRFTEGTKFSSNVTITGTLSATIALTATSTVLGTGGGINLAVFTNETDDGIGDSTIVFTKLGGATFSGALTAATLTSDGAINAPGLITSSAASGQGFVVNATGGKSAALVAGGSAGLFLFDNSGFFTIAAQPSASVIAGTNDGTDNLINVSANGMMLIGNAIGTVLAGTTLQLKDVNAYLTLQNTTNENGEGGAETRIIFEDHADNALAQIEGSHSGTSDDTKGKFLILTNTGGGLTIALTIDDTQKTTFGAGNAGITQMDTIKTAGATVRWVKLTINGVEFWAIADTSLIMN